MNQAIVDRAIEALAKVGATRSPERQADKPRTPSTPAASRQTDYYTCVEATLEAICHSP